MQTEFYKKLVFEKPLYLVELQTVTSNIISTKRLSTPVSLQRTPLRKLSWEISESYTVASFRITSGRVPL